MTTKITLRLASTQDAAQIAEIYAYYVRKTPASFELIPPTPEEMAGRIAAVLEKAPWLVCEQDGEVLGYAYASPHHSRAAYRWSVDVSAYVRNDKQRRGIGHALYTALLDMLPLQGYINAFAGITLPNPTSVGLHEAAGFTLVGVYRGVGYKFDRWFDVGWWQLKLAERPATPNEPLPLQQVTDTPQWQAVLTRAQAVIQASRSRPGGLDDPTEDWMDPA